MASIGTWRKISGAVFCTVGLTQVKAPVDFVLLEEPFSAAFLGQLKFVFYFLFLVSLCLVPQPD